MIDPRVCPGCLFPDAPAGKWPHTSDQRCGKFLAEQAAKGYFLHQGPCPATCICGGVNSPNRWVYMAVSNLDELRRSEPRMELL
jgi:hypothetical protein